MKNNKNFSTINGIVFGVVFVLILIDAVLNIVALISAVVSLISFYSYKKTNDNVSFRKIGLLPVIFFTLGLFLTIIAYIFVFTWGFGILYQ